MKKKSGSLKSQVSILSQAGISPFSRGHLFLISIFILILRTSFTAGQIPRFWEVSLNIQVEGNYSCRLEGRQLEGIFSGSFRWEGVMEPDEPDVILYHFRTHVLFWEVKEKETSGQVSSGFLPVASDPPGLAVTTFLRQGDLFDLHFFIKSFSTPLSSTRPKYRLIMPASFGQDFRSESVRYNDYVFDGSNRIAVSAKDLFTRDLSQIITWSWRFPRQPSSEQGEEFRTEHRVKVELNLKRRFTISEKTAFLTGGFLLTQFGPKWLLSIGTRF